MEAIERDGIYRLQVSHCVSAFVGTDVAGMRQCIQMMIKVADDIRLLVERCSQRRQRCMYSLLCSLHDRKFSIKIPCGGVGWKDKAAFVPTFTSKGTRDSYRARAIYQPGFQDLEANGSEAAVSLSLKL